MPIKHNRITNAAVYIDDVGLVGRCETVKLPDLEMKMTEQKGLGVFGSMELPTGFTAMKGEIKLNSFYSEVFEKIHNPFDIVTLQLRASVNEYDSVLGRKDEKPLVTILRVLFNKSSFGDYKQNDNAEFNASYVCYAIKQIHDGKTILNYDVAACLYEVNGVDLSAKMRKNLGM